MLKQQLTYNLIKLVSTKLWATTKTKEKQSTSIIMLKGTKKQRFGTEGQDQRQR